MVILDLGLRVCQALELYCTGIMLKYVGSYSSVCLQVISKQLQAVCRKLTFNEWVNNTNSHYFKVLIWAVA